MMAMGKKIATRESYGNTLVELAKESMTIWSFWMRTMERPRPVSSKRRIRTGSSIAKSPKAI